MNDKTVGFILIISIILYFFVDYNMYHAKEIAKYMMIVFGLYASFKLVG